MEHAPGTVAPRVFLSYSRQDFALVLDLYRALDDGSSLRPWLDVADIRGGQDWWRYTREAIRSSTVFVLVLSRSSRRSRMVADEVEHARRHEIPIVLVRIDSARVPPELADRPIYDARRRFVPTVDALRDDLVAGRSDGHVPGLAWLPPPAVLLVLAGHASLLAWFVHLAASVPVVPLEGYAAVPWGWIADFTFHLLPGAVWFLAPAVIVSAAVQAYALFSVVRRRIDPARLVGETALAVFVVSVSDVYLLTAARSAGGAIVFPGPWLWQRLLTQDVFIAVGIVVMRTIWRHPDLLRRTIVGVVRRSEFADELDDLTDAPGKGGGEWLDRVLPATGSGPRPRAGTVVIRADPGHADLVGNIRALCERLGYEQVDDGGTAPDRLIVLVDRTSELGRGGGAVVHVLVDTMRIPTDAGELRRAQWVDLRRQNIGGYRDLARALEPITSSAERIPAPVVPERFVVPQSVTVLLPFLLGQCLFALQLLVVRLAVPPDEPVWRILSTGTLLTSLVLGLLLATAAARHSWTPRTFRRCNSVAALMSVATDAVILHDTGWTLVGVVFAVLLLGLQLMLHVGCIAVSGGAWMSLSRPGAPIWSILRAAWPYTVGGVLLLLVATPVLVGLEPLAR